MNILAKDGTKLKATYYSPGKPGPGMLLFHQCNMDRKSCTTRLASTTAFEAPLHYYAFVNFCLPKLITSVLSYLLKTQLNQPGPFHLARC